eukprot:Skav214182  [mRNA]  locus=scaffold945:617183:620427:- [translate_table: standard]
MAQDLMAFDPQSPVHDKDDKKPQDKPAVFLRDLLSSFDPLTAQLAAPGHASLELPPSVAAAFNAPTAAPVTWMKASWGQHGTLGSKAAAPTPEEQRASFGTNS